MKNTGEERINTYFMTVRLQEFINSIPKKKENAVKALQEVFEIWVRGGGT